MAEEVGASLGRGEILQRPVSRVAPEGGEVILRREFADREELAAYVREQFPDAAQRDDGAVSPIRGGGGAAAERLGRIAPRRYGADRNFLHGSVTRLSPYIRHGVLTLRQVLRHALETAGPARQMQKFVSELAWRDYWRQLYARWGDGVWLDRESYKTGYSAAEYAPELPEDIAAGTTGLACMDTFSRELLSTGYLHNHARMWMAAYVVHWRRVKWQAGARWFLTHLLDGDPASNNLSWQWVASTFSAKPYFFNRENLDKYSGGLFCGTCPARGACPFDGSYEQLSATLFRIEADR